MSEDVVPGVTGKDLAALAGVGLLVAPPLVLVGLDKWREACEWCSDHGLLTPADSDPLVELPRTGGIGFSGLQLAIAVAAIVVLSLLCTWIGRRWRRARLARAAARGA